MRQAHEGFAIAERAIRLAKRLKPAYAEAFVEHAHSRFFPIEQGIFNGEGYEEHVGVRLRMIKEGRLYTLSTNDAGGANIERLLGRYKSFSGMQTRMAPDTFEEASYKVKEKRSVDSSDMLRDIIAVDKRLGSHKYVKYRNVYSYMGRAITTTLNTDGARVESDMPYTGLFVLFTVVIKGQARQCVLQRGATGGYELFAPDKIIEDLDHRAKAAATSLEKGVTLTDAQSAAIKNVVAAPEIVGIAVHESVGHPLEADRVFGREAAQAGTSYITPDNLGMRIGSDKVTLIDDPTIENAYGYYLYDDEGVKARPKYLVEGGMQKELLMNREYASVLGQRSNGSARSDNYSNEPLVRMSNTFLKPGDSTLDELIREAGDGVLIKNFTEWNIDDTRTFSRYQGNEAYMIKNGEIGKPVKNYKLERSTTEFWGAVRMLSKDFELYVGNCGKGEPMQGVSVTMGGPYALLTFG